MSAPPPPRMPATFLAHGSPFLLDDLPWREELAAWARAMPRPKAILTLSAHWLDAPVTLGATRTLPLVYDFYGFPQKYYDVKYPAPGAPEVAARVRTLLSARTSASSPTIAFADAPERGLDHGAYMPLIAMYPDADVPVLQVSIPTMNPAPLFDLGRALAPLRDEGVLIMGSGFLTHNLRSMAFGTNPKPPQWATDFDDWCKDVLARRDVDALLQYRKLAPGVQQALPTHEHFVPVVVAMGASIEHADAVQFPIEGFTYGTGAKRSVQFG